MGRTSGCDSAEARKRLEMARQFFAVASLVADDRDEDASLLYANAASSLAILAGIAAADAACCAVLGERSRSQNHHDAERFVQEIQPDGAAAAKHLRGLLNLKDKAHYGFLAVNGSELTSTLRKAEALISFAESVVQR